MSKRIGIYPGTFDPATNGHLDIIHRGTALVDRLIVGVAVNPGKGPLFTLDERVALVKREVAALPLSEAASFCAACGPFRISNTNSRWPG